MYLAHKIQLSPTSEQIQYFAKACGIARKAYNWGLEEWEKQYKMGLKPNGNKLQKYFNSIKEEQFPYMYEVTKWANQQPFENLQEAYVRFFKKQANKPKFKKKGKRDSFYIGLNCFEINDKCIKIPKLKKKIKLTQPLRFDGKLISATISRQADKWFVSITVELPDPIIVHENQMTIGVDLGINALATLSTGEKFFAPKPFKKFKKKLRRMQRSLSRMTKGSKNREKLKVKISRLYYKMTCIRNDCLHKTTTYISKNYGFINIEDLNVLGMLKNHRLAFHISDLGFYEFKRQLEYKQQIYGSKVFKVDRFFPSSKLCSNCHSKKETLSLSEREYVCEHCGLIIDRDLNAAINLQNYTAEDAANTAGYAGIDACGHNGSVKKSKDDLTTSMAETRIRSLNHVNDLSI